MEVNINFVIALIGIILAIFGSAWLTKQQFLQFRIDDLEKRFKRVDKRFERLEKRFENTRERF